MTIRTYDAKAETWPAFHDGNFHSTNPYEVESHINYCDKQAVALAEWDRPESAKTWRESAKAARKWLREHFEIVDTRKPSWL